MIFFPAGMVSKKDKAKMKDFVLGRVEDASDYDIKKADNSHILVAQKPEFSENPVELYIVLHNKKMNLSDYKRLVSQNTIDGKFSVDVFYKNGSDFMVRLGGRAKFKGDFRSLKRYGKEDLDKMIHLRGLEKEVLNNQGNNPILTYFQPQTERLVESLRGYNMETVFLDYSHIKPGDPGYGFVKPSTSIDYMIANESHMLEVVDGPVGFKAVSDYPRRKAVIVPKN